MKTITAKNFSDLSEQKQADLILKEKILILEMIIDGIITCEDLQPNFKRAYDKANNFRTPWFLGEILMEDKEIASFVQESAECNLNETLFVELSDVAVMIV